MKKSLLMLALCLAMGTYVRAEVLVSTFGPNNGLGDIVWDIDAGGSHPEAMSVAFTPAHDSNLTQIDLGFYTFTANRNLVDETVIEPFSRPGGFEHSRDQLLRLSLQAPQVLFTGKALCVNLVDIFSARWSCGEPSS